VSVRRLAPRAGVERESDPAHDATPRAPARRTHALSPSVSRTVLDPAHAVMLSRDRHPLPAGSSRPRRMVRAVTAASMRIRFLGFVTTCVTAYPPMASAQGDEPRAGDAAPPAPAGADEPSADAGRKPPATRAALHGSVRDAESGLPVAGAAVEAVGASARAETDENGRYRLELPPGVYAVRYWVGGYQSLRATQVRVFGGMARKIDVALKPDQTEAFELVVEAKPDTASVDALAIERRKATSVGDAVGRAEIARTPDRDAAQAARRVVGATIEGNRFVYVRGLGERYTNAQLNGAPLPSPEPDRAAVPLDLFPTQVLESLTIVKTFTPDSPGDFAGGSVRIQTRRVPQDFLFSSSLSFGFNTTTTFKQRLSHRGGSLDWLGIDDGTRALPGSVPGDYPLTLGVEKPNGDYVLDRELTAQGNELNTFMSATRGTALPDHGASIVAGNGWRLGKDVRVGFLASVNYRRGYTIRHEERRVLEPDPASPTGLRTLNALDVELGAENVSWGTFASLMSELGKHHRLNLVAFHSQLADNDTQTFDGFWSRNDATLHTTRLRFVTRALNVLQLQGEHELERLSGAKLDWNVSYSVAARDEPDTRDVVYQLNPTLGAYTYVDGSESGRHFFSSQSEKAYGLGADFTQPLEHGERATSLKVGGLVSIKDREFNARRFSFRRVPGTPADPFTCPGTTYDESCPDSLFVPGNIGTALRLQENTRPEDAYTAGLDVYAAYVMTDASLARDLRLVAGERIEVTRQKIEPFDQFDSGATVRGADLKSTDQLPAAALVFDATPKSKLRLGVSRTLARPQLRELAPFAYSDFFGGRLTAGNPDLRLTRITNADLRFEHFPKLSEVLAFSVFYKQFQDPIEPVVTPSGDSGLITFQNAEGANLLGVELEARFGLDHFSPSARGFSLVSNLTVARSRIEVRQTDADFLTNTSRPMVNQAPYVLNLALDYENEALGLNTRLLYNVNGARLVEVGAEGLDDAYEHPRHRLDLVAAKELGKHVQVKLSATNLIDPERVVTIGKELRDDRVTIRYRDGRSFAVGASWKY
jgi:hypothetical protein